MRRMPKMIRLDLHGNSIQSLEFVEVFPNLQELYIKDNADLEVGAVAYTPNNNVENFWNVYISIDSIDI